MNLFVSLKPNRCKYKNKKTNHTEIHITEISQSRHDIKAWHACGMTKKRQGNQKMKPP